MSNLLLGCWGEGLLVSSMPAYAVGCVFTASIFQSTGKILSVTIIAKNAEIKCAAKGIWNKPVVSHLDKVKQNFASMELKRKRSTKYFKILQFSKHASLYFFWVITHKLLHKFENSPPGHWRRVSSRPDWRSSPPSTNQETLPSRSPDTQTHTDTPRRELIPCIVNHTIQFPVSVFLWNL